VADNQSKISKSTLESLLKSGFHFREILNLFNVLK